MEVGGTPGLGSIVTERTRPTGGSDVPEHLLRCVMHRMARHHGPVASLGAGVGGVAVDLASRPLEKAAHGVHVSNRVPELRQLTLGGGGFQGGDRPARRARELPHQHAATPMAPNQKPGRCR